MRTEVLHYLQGLEIGYKRAERLGRTYSEYGDEPAQPSEAGCAVTGIPSSSVTLHMHKNDQKDWYICAHCLHTVRVCPRGHDRYPDGYSNGYAGSSYYGATEPPHQLPPPHHEAYAAHEAGGYSNGTSFTQHSAAPSEVSYHSSDGAPAVGQPDSG
jgi:hypothetical protein